jgi:RimJ/RimL family protein N-acetyltransferase
MQMPDFDRFWPPPHPDSYTALLQRYRWLQQLDGALELDAIVTANASGEPFAWLKLSGIDYFNRKAEFSVYVHHLRGTRASLEALVAGVDLSMSLVDKLVAHTMPANQPAQQILACLGFAQEGCLRGEVRGREAGRCDVLRYGLMREDWLLQPLRAMVARKTLL